MTTQAETIIDATEAKESLAKKIWLAGLGAYGQGFSEAIDRYSKVNKKSQELFAELVNKGQEIETHTRDKLVYVKSQSSESLEQSINQVREKLGFAKSEEAEKLDNMAVKVDALTDLVNKLVDAKVEKKPTARSTQAK